MAHAAKHTLATYEEFFEGDLAADAGYAAGTIAALYLDGIAPAKLGAWPLAFTHFYDADNAHLSAYAKAARTDEGFARYLAEYVIKQPVIA